MKNGIIACVLTLLLLGSGCADFKTYMRDRGNDLADCFTVRYGMACGIGARVQVTSYTGASVGFLYAENKKGWYGREPFSQYSTLYERDMWVGMPFIQLISWIPFVSNNDSTPMKRIAGFTCLLLGTDIRRSRGSLPEAVNVLGINFGDAFISEGVKHGSHKDSTPLLRRNFFIEVSIPLLYVGFDFGFNPVEFVDFLLGWTTLDITGDDAVPETEQEAEP
jgi:hypothetical protein